MKNNPLKFLFLFSFILLVTGCAVQSAMPLGNDMMQIDVSASPVYGRAGAQSMAYKKAAQATLDAGYDKFIVVNNAGWTEGVASGSSYGQVSGNASGFSGSSGSTFNTFRKPEISMVIRMFHKGQKGGEKAVDAHKILEAKK